MYYLPHMTSRQAKAAFTDTDLAIIPTGSVESHGPHLGTGADYLVAEEIAKRVAARTKGILVPVLPYGYSSNHVFFHGTVSLRPETFRAALDDICASLHSYGTRRFLFVNGHSGNVALLQQVCDRLRSMESIGCIANWWALVGHLSDQFTPTGHGDYMEASAMLAIHPEAVRMSDAVPFKPKALTDRLNVVSWDRLSFKGVVLQTWVSTKQASDTGSTGKLDGAAAERGEAAIQAAAEFLAELADELRKVDLKQLFAESPVG